MLAWNSTTPSIKHHTWTSCSTSHHGSAISWSGRGEAREPQAGCETSHPWCLARPSPLLPIILASAHVEGRHHESWERNLLERQLFMKRRMKKHHDDRKLCSRIFHSSNFPLQVPAPTLTTPWRVRVSWVCGPPFPLLPASWWHSDACLRRPPTPALGAALQCSIQTTTEAPFEKRV